MNPVYFIGAGPGSPEYLTLQGSRCLEACRSVFALEPYEELFASLLEGKKVLVPFDYSFRDLIVETDRLRREGPVGFLIPGDQTF